MKKNIYLSRILALTILAALFTTMFIGIVPVAAQAETRTVVFDISHGQEDDHGGTFDTVDALLEANLTAMGFDVVWASGGLNATILEDADALIIGSIFGDQNYFLPTEISAISDWFDTGNKFLWVAYDSDFTRAPTEGKFIQDNATAILEAVDSHVYGEPTALYDSRENVDDQSYRVVANETSSDAFVADLVDGVTRVMTHSPTILYGSNSATPSSTASPVALETNTIANVYPVLYSSANAQIQDGDVALPIAHTDGTNGSYVLMTVEVGAGATGSNVIAVSGSKPYGGYHPMIDYSYAEEDMNGYLLVQQTIDWAIEYANRAADMTLIWVSVGVGAVVVVLLIVYFVRRK